MRFPNIALLGRARSGKTTVARYLQEQYDYIEFAFGEELKRHADEIFGKSEKKDRKLYQWFGEKMREYDPLVWVKIVDRGIDEHEKQWSNPVIISDMRQKHEYEYAIEKEFLIIKIESDMNTRINRMIELNDDFTVKDLTHDTEQVVDELAPHIVLQNNGNLDDLYRKVTKVITEGKYGSSKNRYE